MYYLNKDELVSYIIGKHGKDKGLCISPIKLQKSLYLLYAMWSGNARKLNMSKENDSHKGICEEDNTLIEDLFKPNFQAWKYGPVDPEVYKKFKHYNCYEGKNSLKFNKTEIDTSMQSMILSFIDETLEQIFDISDFTLVDITHEDSSWKETFNANPLGNGQIDSAAIKDEYYNMVHLDEN